MGKTRRGVGNKKKLVKPSTKKIAPPGKLMAIGEKMAYFISRESILSRENIAHIIIRCTNAASGNNRPSSPSACVPCIPVTRLVVSDPIVCRYHTTVFPTNNATASRLSYPYRVVGFDRDLRYIQVGGGPCEQSQKITDNRTQ